MILFATRLIKVKIKNNSERRYNLYPRFFHIYRIISLAHIQTQLFFACITLKTGYKVYHDN